MNYFGMRLKVMREERMRMVYLLDSERISDKVHETGLSEL